MDNLVDVNLVDRRCQPYWYFHYRYLVALYVTETKRYGSGDRIVVSVYIGGTLLGT